VQEWKKKYVTMCEDGRMTYHPPLHDHIFLTVYCVQEWKKKYVTMCEDGRMTYHPSLHDYISDSVLCAGMEEEIRDDV
jgi:hypothetical protein